MPELPEVEVVCRGLSPHLIDRTIESMRFSGLKLRLPYPSRSSQNKIIGAKIVSVTRRAKYVVIGTGNDTYLIIHLGMTGRLGIFSHDQPSIKHDHGFWLLDNNTEMRFNDTRRFGSVQVALSGTELENLFTHFGPDPFSRRFTAKYLSGKARHRKASVKNFIMNNKVVPGIGNIYANETLYAAGINPAKTVASLALDEWRKIVTHSRRILKKAIDSGGTTISDFVNSSGKKGYFQVSLLVYGNNGKSCIKCKEIIKKTVIGGRATYMCPKCQK